MQAHGFEKRTYGCGKEKIQELSNGQRLLHQGDSLSASGTWLPAKPSANLSLAAS
jgi:hypothetical protein